MFKCGPTAVAAFNYVFCYLRMKLMCTTAYSILNTPLFMLVGYIKTSDKTTTVVISVFEVS